MILSRLPKKERKKVMKAGLLQMYPPPKLSRSLRFAIVCVFSVFVCVGGVGSRVSFCVYLWGRHSRSEGLKKMICSDLKEYPGL